MDRSVETHGEARRRVDACFRYCRTSSARAHSPPPHQANTHYYALPDQLHAMLDAAGFEVEATFGGFGGEAYDEDESDHLIFAARLRD